MSEQTTNLADEFADSIDGYEPPPFDPTVDIFVYGETGAGKTTLIKTLKDDCMAHDGRCLLLTNDKGEESILSAIYDPDEWLIPREVESVRDIRGAAKMLIEMDHPFRWVALDDTTRMAGIMNDELKEEFGEDVWGRYQALNSRFRSLLRTFRGIDVNSLFLAREGTKEDSDRKTAAFPGKALGEGNDRSSVLHEFTFGFRMVREHREDQVDKFYLQTRATPDAEAKCRDEWHVLEDREVPDLSALRQKWVDAQREHIGQEE